MYWKRPASDQVTWSNRSQQSQTPVCVCVSRCVPAHFTLISLLFFFLPVSGPVSPVSLPLFSPWLMEEEAPLRSSRLLWTDSRFFSDYLHLPLVCVPPAEIRRGYVWLPQRRLLLWPQACAVCLSNVSLPLSSRRSHQHQFLSQHGPPHLHTSAAVWAEQSGGVFINNLFRLSQRHLNAVCSVFI